MHGAYEQAEPDARSNGETPRSSPSELARDHRTEHLDHDRGAATAGRHR